MAERNGGIKESERICLICSMRIRDRCRTEGRKKEERGREKEEGRKREREGERRREDREREEREGERERRKKPCRENRFSPSYASTAAASEKQLLPKKKERERERGN